MTYIWMIQLLLLVGAFALNIVGSMKKNKDMYHTGNGLMVIAFVMYLYFGALEGEGKWTWTYTSAIMVAAIIALSYSSLKYFLKDRKRDE